MGSPRSPEASGSAPSGDRPARASIARVHDAALGGTDNSAIDRQVLDQVRAVAPEVDDLAWSNRRSLGRAGSFVVVAHSFDQETDELGPLARRMEQVLRCTAAAIGHKT